MVGGIGLPDRTALVSNSRARAYSHTPTRRTPFIPANHLLATTNGEAMTPDYTFDDVRAYHDQFNLRDWIGMAS